MKSAICLVGVALLLIATIGSPVFAQPGTLELFADQAGTACVLADTPYIQSVFVFQTGGASATLVGDFSAPKPACWNTTWVGDRHAEGLKIGSSQTKILVAFGVCRPIPAFVLEIQYLAGGTATPCCKYEITMATEYVNCGFGQIPGMIIGPRNVTINPDPTCPCMFPVSTESSTWGRVKSLYR